MLGDIKNFIGNPNSIPFTPFNHYHEFPNAQKEKLHELESRVILFVPLPKARNYVRDISLDC